MLALPTRLNLPRLPLATLLVACEGTVGPIATTIPAVEQSAAGAAGYQASLAADGGSDAGMGGGAGHAATEGGRAGAPSSIEPQHRTLWTDGRSLRDTCGELLVIRGAEQILGEELPPDNDWAGLIDEIALTGANAVRILPDVETLGISGVDAVLSRVEDRGMVAFLAAGDSSWLARDEVRVLLGKYSSLLVLEAYGGAEYDDRARFVSEAKARIAAVRSYGYEEPLIVSSNQFGRDLPVLLESGAEIVETDALENTILGWQAHWGDSGWYQDQYGMTVEQGISAVAELSFPVQLGLVLITDDDPTEYLDYPSAMNLTQELHIGWLWWDWYNPYGSTNNLSTDGSAQNLTEAGQDVVLGHAAGIRATSRLPCRAE